MSPRTIRLMQSVHIYLFLSSLCETKLYTTFQLLIGYEVSSWREIVVHLTYSEVSDKPKDFPHVPQPATAIYYVVKEGQEVCLDARNIKGDRGKTDAIPL